MSYSVSLQTVIESVEALSPEEQELLLNWIHRRRVEKQRQERAGKATQTLEELHAGNAACDIRAAEEPKFWGDEGAKTYHVLIKKEPEGGVSATLLGWAECKAVGATRQEAVLRLHDLVSALLAEAEIVPVKIRSTQSDNPWIRLAGKYKDDPLFDEFLADIEAYRREVDAESEAYYRELEAQGEEK
jgi:predicted RNase H-like HicB family nuclease